MPTTDTLGKIRIDKWLWAVRLFKTRSMAATACNAGKIKRDGIAIKPSTTVKPGDRIEVPVHDNTYKKDIEVVQILGNRVGAPLAAKAYIDHTSELELQIAEERRQAIKASRLLRKDGDQGRMTKKRLREWKKGLHFGDQHQP